MILNDPAFWTSGIFAPSRGAVTITITGIETVGIYPSSAPIGAEIDVLINGEAPTGNIRFGSTPGGDEYGELTPAQLPFTVPGDNDTDDPDNPAVLYVSSVTTGESFSRSYAIRAALPVNTVAPALVNSDPTGSDLGDTITMTAGTWIGAASVTQRIFADGDLLDEDASASHVITVSESLNDITGEEEAVSSGGRESTNATGAFTVDEFTAPTLDAPLLSGTLAVGQTLSATAQNEAGNPVPTGAWQWYRGTTAISGATGASYLLVEADEGLSNIKVRRTLTNALDSAFAETTISGTVAAAPSGVTLSITSIGPQSSDGSVPVGYTISADDTVELLVYPSSLADPDAGDFNTGSTDLEGYYDIGTAALTEAGSSFNVTGPDGLLGNYKVAGLTSSGNIEVSTVVFIDSTAGVLSPASGSTGSGTGEVDYSFVPDENGTYRASLYTNGATPSNADLEDGTGAVDTETGTGTADTPATGTLTGSAATAYDLFLFFDDGVGNKTYVGPIDVTSGAASASVEFDQAGSGIAEANSGTTSITASVTKGAADASRQFLCVFTGRLSGSPVSGGWQVRAVDSAVTVSAEFLLSAPSRFAVIWAFVLDIPTGTSVEDFVFERNTSSLTIDGGTFTVVRMVGDPVLTASTLQFNSSAVGGTPETLTPSINIADDDGILACAACHISPGDRGLGSGEIAWSGTGLVDIVDGGSFNGGGSTAIAPAGVLSAATPYSATATFDWLVSGNDFSALLIKASAP